MLADNIKPDYSSMAAILQNVADKKLLLPEFQRRFVWSIEQSKDLFDSLVRGIFIGAFTLAKPQFDLSCREIDIRPRSGKGSKSKIDPIFYRKSQFESDNSFVVLDGQQRITSIYRVLKGYDKLYFVFKKPDFISKSSEIDSIELIIDSISPRPLNDNFCVELSQVYDCANWREEKVRTRIFEPAADEYSVLDGNNYQRNRYFECLLELRRLFKDLIDDKTLLSVFFLNMGIEKFCMYFERSNSKGTVLNFIDIITAKIYKDFNLDGHIKSFQSTNKAIFFDDSIVEAIVRYMSYLKENRVDRKTILTFLDGSDFNRYWKEICELYVKVVKYLTAEDLIYSIDKVPYSTMFIPMIHFVRNIPHRDFTQMTPQQRDAFRFWFWGSLLNTRYGGGLLGSTNDVIVQDCDMLEKIAKRQKFDKEFLKQFRFDFDYDDLLDLTSPGAIFIGIMSIVNNKYQMKNLSNANAVDFTDAHVHHIFPINYLETKFADESFENENVHSILNKLLIGKIPNIKFGDKAPSEYLNSRELRENASLKASLDSHLIPQPERLISGDFDRLFEEFAKERALQIIALIDQELGSMKQEYLAELATTT